MGTGNKRTHQRHDASCDKEVLHWRTASTGVLLGKVAQAPGFLGNQLCHAMNAVVSGGMLSVAAIRDVLA